MQYNLLLKDIRYKRSLTQVELAIIMCCSQAYISNLESDTMKPSPMFINILKRYIKDTKFRVEKKFKENK